VIVLSSLLGFAIWQYRLKIKSEKQLQYLNSDLNLKNYQLLDKTKIIETQHNTIHQKNKEITDSIRYAHKIQTAMMPLKHEFASYFKESFVLFEPKDIISGDFFWITTRNEKIIFATGDCTGHGVPGGFMSMLGVSLLNEIINEHDLTEPALILSRLRKKVITALRQKGLSGEQQDGMDMTICVIDKQEMTLHYAAANHVFYIIRKNEYDFDINEYKGDKQPVGIFGKELKPFRQHLINLKPNDVIYAFTDGYADQFGGPKGKKFKYTQLKDLLLSIQNLNLEEQEEIIKRKFIAWKGNLEQVDDVCLIGIKI
jgi:serine phosphatase RsbU (regulator of sigma subunit)